MALIEVQNITKIFGKAPDKELAKVKNGMGKDQLLAETDHTLGLHDVSLSIEKGEIFVIMGLSGSGKSTLIRHFNRLIDPTDGHILVDGEDVMALSDKELEEFRRHRMSMVFQRFGLMPHRTVLQNVAYGLEVQGITKADRETTAREWIETVGLGGFEHQYPSQLSGGMQQRVGLARALATDADILLMDEAFSALDPLIRSQMQDQLVELQEKLHKTIVFITHDLDEALRIGDKIAILKDGVLSQVGTPPEILLEPADDYVRAFVRDVNRARVLTVDTVMQPPAVRITHDNMEKALADMRRHDEDFGYVVEDKEFRGIVTQEGLAEEVAKPGDSPSLYAFADDSNAVELESTLEEALPTTLEADYPVPVVCEDGHLMGVLSPEEMGSVLTPPEEQTDAETEGAEEKNETAETAKPHALKEAS
ncbi:MULTISPECIES: glycine betaine/L-proline ABC transporter ATP-binding protein [unclassified Pseudovibrio]|uniref:quaternary amine ABC transporter ATP-binding protein n=1 Tax=unclassified Pseudovibrio TaxID=2627060 RepID=UPI0007AE5F77|nr:MULTISPECIES: glycine betaine/L-proline ABC transporter ATP-binding protein [unclassified Pseudovibrio]KZK99752.1 Glycine betaine/carnitine transport ATP-binding protein GbuA [Pseudovibrio sp. W74]KZL11947.1 Glycine betaine/carnitine transport ATP-binding protein GbuA [Pseudovibrio sp. Ad14]